jgi:Zn ribbon nucleic-acid-binding protein
MQSEIVRSEANISADQVIMTCVATGYSDDDFVANHVRSRRRPNEQVATFIGFDED